MKSINMRYFKNIAVVLILGSIAHTSNSLTSVAAVKKLPDRCAYTYAAAGYRVGSMVSSQIKKSNADNKIQQALESVSLAKELQCPVTEMTKVIDCVVDLVRQSSGEEPEPIGVIECIEKITEQDFPKLPG
jgi:hypothetical protein